MAENQSGHQHENRDLQEVDRNTDSYTGRFRLEVYSAAIIVGFLLAFLSGPRDVLELIFVAIITVILLIIVGMGSMIFAGIARFCLGIFLGRKFTGETVRWASYIFRCFILALIASMVFLIYDGRQNPPGSTAEASNIISNLRSLQSASLALYSDKGEAISELPRGVNIIEYLTRYMPNSESPVWNNYIFIIRDSYWWAGFDLVQSHTRRNIRNMLFSRRNIGLFGTSQPEPPPSNDDDYLYARDDFVWLIVRVLQKIDREEQE